MAKKDKHKARKEAQGTVHTLFTKAEDTYKENPSLAHEFIRKLRNAAMRVQMKLPLTLKRRICKHCYHLLVPGKNCRIRTAKSHVVIYCLDCKKHTRIPY